MNYPRAVNRYDTENILSVYVVRKRTPMYSITIVMLHYLIVETRRILELATFAAHILVEPAPDGRPGGMR